MKAVILTGGNGTRMGSITKNIPKPMVTIGERPILWHIMKAYSKHNVKDFIICTGYKYEVINEYFKETSGNKAVIKQNKHKNVLEINNYDNEGWNILLVYTGKETNTGGRIKRIKNYLCHLLRHHMSNKMSRLLDNFLFF